MELDCGILRQRLVDWLDGELALARSNGTWRFEGASGACDVTLTPLPDRSLGTMSFERTSIRIDGDEDAVEEFMHLFTMRFASAGG